MSVSALSKPVIGMHQNFLRSSQQTRSPSQFLSLNANESAIPSERSSLSSKNSSPMSSSNPFHPDSPLNSVNPRMSTNHPLDLNYPRFPLGQPTPFPVQPSGTNRNAIFVPQVPNVPKVFAHFGKGTEMLATYEKFESALRRGIPKVPETETPAAQPVLNFCANPNQKFSDSFTGSQTAPQSSESSSSSATCESNNGESKSTNLQDSSADNNANDTPQSSNGSAVLNFLDINPLFSLLTFCSRNFFIKLTNAGKMIN